MTHPLRHLAAAALLLASAFLAGCTVNPATGESSFTGFMSTADENRIGQQSHPEILQEFGGAYGTPQLQSYIQTLGTNLAANSERKDVKYTFTVLNTPIVNAFAVPGGYIYITRGLLALANDEAEVAGVLSHEIGHIVARHSAQRYSQGVLAQIGVIGLGILTGSQELTNLASYGAQAWLQSYSRDQEFQADQLGVRYLSRASYDPQAMAAFLSSLQADARLEATIEGHPETVDQFNIMQTHPRTADRVQRAIAEAQATTPVPNPKTEREPYLDEIDGILYGDDPKQGIARGRHFSHPDLRLAFDAPEGFQLANGTDAVQGLGPNNSAMIFDGGRASIAGSMADYIANVWAAKIRLQSLDSVTIDGMEAATATASGNTSRGAVFLRLVAIRYDANTIYRFIYLCPTQVAASADAGFRQSAASFRKLSASEAAQIRPLRVRIITVKPGDSISSLAKSMAFEDYQEQRFRVLNGLSANQGLTAGQHVKLIVE
jgi:predicted Zn-dependent protease